MRFARMFASHLVLCILSLLFLVGRSAHPAFAVQGPPAVATGATNAAPVAPTTSTPPKNDLLEGAYRFAIAKSLAAEGAWAEALSWFAEAEGFAPDDPFILAEHALLLARLSQSPLPAGAGGAERAKALIDRAQNLAPDDVDLLRTASQVYLTLAGRSPGALDAAVAVLESLRAKAPADVQALIPLGRIYLDRGEAKKAADLFSDLIKFVPNNRMAAGLLIESLLRSQQTAEAERALADLVRADPESIEARSTLADLLEHRGDLQGARKLLEQAPEEVRGDPQIRRQLASVLYFSGDLEAALRLVDELLGEAKKAPGAEAGRPGEGEPNASAEATRYLLRLRGMILAALGRTSEAIEVLSRLAKEAPDDLPVALALARCLDRAGRLADAEKSLLTAAGAAAEAGKGEESNEARLELAGLLSDGKAWARVGEAVKPLLTSSDEDVRSRAILFAVDAQNESRGAAAGLDLLASYVGSGTPSAPLAAKRAELLLRGGREAEGKAELAKIEATGPGGAFAVAQVYQRLERYADGLPILNKLTAAKPDLAAGWFLLGAALERSGETQKSIDAFRRALEIEPDFHSALNYLGYMWADRGENLDEALAMILKAVALDPENGAYVDSLGWVRFRLKEYPTARTLLERAARLMPRDASVQEHLGDLYRSTGETALAREAYRRALALESDNALEVKKKLSELSRR